MAYFDHKLLLVSVFVLVLVLQTPLAVGSVDEGKEMLRWAGYGEEKLSTVIISGTVLCNAAHAPPPHKPVSGARVGVFCGWNRKTRKVSSAKGRTDGSGKFSIDLPSELHAIPNIEKVCHVRVVKLPESCACSTRHNKGIALTSIHQGIRTYSTQNIHLNYYQPLPLILHMLK